MIRLIDQTGNPLILDHPPAKIISLVPSQTELLAALSLNQETIGITKFCIHPNEWFKTKQIIGGTKNLNRSVIDALQPDLIIANKEENSETQVKELMKDFPVYCSDIKTLEDALGMIKDIGMLTNRNEQAAELIDKISMGFSSLKKMPPVRTAYLIWQKPYMVAGGDTFINDMMNRCGFINIFKEKPRYPETTIEALNNLKCELLILSSEPFPFKNNHAEAIQSAGFKGQILLADGEMFSWYGSRLMMAPGYFESVKKRVSTQMLRR